MDNAERLGVERISTLLLRLSLPSVLGMLAITIYNVADTIFVGQAVGVGAIAGLSVTLPLMLMINNTFGQAVGLGGASIISRALGARNRELAELVLHNLVFMILCLNVLLFGLVIAFLPDLLRLFGADDSILPYSMEYAVWCLPGSFAMNIFFVFINVIRAEGNTKFAMWCQVLTAVINLVLDPIFIFIFGWGVKGAAVATSISQIVSAVLGLWYFRRSKKSVLSLSYRECFKLPKPKVLGETLALGSASFGRQLAHSSTSIVLNNVLGGVGGSMAIAAYGIINRLTMFV
ncbi:MAG: MATE family efflux transporter, partial [Bacteroidales bacterium]|nr:MATE family efflux transporter [Bacteroidales bacterium]